MTTTTSPVDDGVGLRRTLLREFQIAAEDARQAVADIEDGLGRAVHGYRKALRRARALLRLLGPALAKRERRDIQRALTSARRALGPARDHAVATDVLGEITEDAEHRVARAVLERAAASALASADIKQLLAEGAARAAAQVEMLDAALPAQLEWYAVVDGVRATYADARKARRDAKHSRHAFHRWRRRSKELAIQLDVVSRVMAPELTEWREQLLAATDHLGGTVDILMARDFVRTHGAGIADEEITLLSRYLARQLDDKVEEARRQGRDAFRKKPRALARKLARAVKRGATPVAAPPSSRAEEFAMT